MKRRRWTVLIAVILAVVLLGNRGFRRVVTGAIQLRRMHKELATLQKEESSLHQQLQQAQSSDHVLETTARRELGYLKSGEVEYRFPPPKKSTAEK